MPTFAYSYGMSCLTKPLQDKPVKLSTIKAEPSIKDDLIEELKKENEVGIL